METIKCKGCGMATETVFQGFHICTAPITRATAEHCINQRNPVSYIRHVSGFGFGCSEHPTQIPGFYKFEDILRTKCLECLRSIMSLDKPHYSWKYYVDPQFYNKLTSDNGKAIWRMAHIRTSVGADEINVLEDRCADDVIYPIGVYDSEFLIKLHDAYNQTGPAGSEVWPWSLNPAEMFIWACENGMTPLVKWLVETGLEGTSEELGRQDYNNIDEFIVAISKKYPKSELLELLLTCDLRNGDWTRTQTPKEIIIDHPYITYEFYTPGLCSGCLEVCGCQYTGWKTRRMRDEEGEEDLISKATGLVLENGRVCRLASGYVIYYGNEKDKGAVIAVIRYGKVLSVCRDPSSSCQEGNYCNVEESDIDDNLHCVRLMNEGTVLIRYW